MIQTADIAPVPQVSDVASMAGALEMEQIQATTHLVNLEASKVSLERRLKDASGREADMLRNRLSETIGAIEGEKAKIANLKGRLAELQGAAPRVAEVGMPAIPPVWIEDRPRMFGLNKDEFLGIFILLLAMPIVLAVSRRLWIRGVPKKKAEQPAIEADRLQRLEQMVEAVAIEVERIGESQRFQSKLMAEKRPNEPRRVNTPH